MRILSALLMFYMSSTALAAPESEKVVDRVCMAYDSFVVNATDIQDHEGLEKAIKPIEINAIMRGVHTDCLAYVLTDADKEKLTASSLALLGAIAEKKCQLLIDYTREEMVEMVERYTGFLTAGIQASYTLGDFVDLMDGRRGWNEKKCDKPVFFKVCRIRRR